MRKRWASHVTCHVCKNVPLGINNREEAYQNKLGSLEKTSDIGNP